MKVGKAAAEVQALPCVMLGQEVRLRPEQGGVTGRRDASSISRWPARTCFPQLYPGERQDPGGGQEQAELREVERAVSDSSPGM